jgi:hypothetical protein
MLIAQVSLTIIINQSSIANCNIFIVQATGCSSAKGGYDRGKAITKTVPVGVAKPVKHSCNNYKIEGFLIPSDSRL